MSVPLANVDAAEVLKSAGCATTRGMDVVSISHPAASQHPINSETTFCCELSDGPSRGLYKRIKVET